MRALIQRVSKAEIRIENSSKHPIINRGLLILLGVTHDDSAEHVTKLASKIANLRIFSNQDGKFDLSVLDIKGDCLVVSQFTLYGDTSKGRRPDFTTAAKPDVANKLYEGFIAELKSSGIENVQSGEFGAHMQIDLANDGPVTLMIEV
ncbi:D-aminoacyl-tRNA deacylase [Elusimicrobiota bacterium]